jgi:hypothetical protein
MHHRIETRQLNAGRVIQQITIRSVYLKTVLGQEVSMRISNVRVLLLSAPIPPERRWTTDFGTNTKQDVAIVIVETND